MRHLKLTYLLLLLPLFASAQTVYKYKNERGEWVYSDQPPQNTEKFEQQRYVNKVKKNLKPRIYNRSTEQGKSLVVDNPFFAPIQLEISAEVCGSELVHKVVKARSTKVVCEREFVSGKRKSKYRWMLGDPKARHDKSTYKMPYQSNITRTITQSFNGMFSHKKEPNVFAVDIALPVGSNIVAARAGTVVSVKDDYHMGGTTQYFLDKANYVRVLHSDGTFADYGHILLGTAQVKAGDKVAAGAVLAKSGSSGFSTGPHLHFVVRRNAGFTYKSVPFLFERGNGKSFMPKAGMEVIGQ